VYYLLFYPRIGKCRHHQNGRQGQRVRKLTKPLCVGLFARQLHQVQPTPKMLAYWPELAQIIGVSRALQRCALASQLSSNG